MDKLIIKDNETGNLIEIYYFENEIIIDSIKIIKQIWQWLSLWISFAHAVLRSQDIKVFLCLLWFDFKHN